MKTLRQITYIKMLACLLFILVGLGPVMNPAWGYAPIDDLINQVDQLRQNGEISDLTSASNLIVSLQAIGTTIDAGDSVTAKKLISAFIQEVDSLSGIFIIPTAANQLINSANNIANSI